MDPLAEDFSTALSVLDRSSRKKISNDIVELNSTINQLDIIEMYRPLLLTSAEYSILSSSHRHSTLKTTFWVIKHTLTNLKRQKSCSVFSQMTRKLNQNLITGNWKIQKYMDLNSILLNNTRVKEISKEILKYFE